MRRSSRALRRLLPDEAGALVGDEQAAVGGQMDRAGGVEPAQRIRSGATGGGDQR